MPDVTLNPDRARHLSDERVTEISRIAAGMPGDVPVAGWLSDLCADLFTARAELADARRAALEEALDKMAASSVGSYRAVERMIEAVRALLDSARAT